MVKEPTAQSAAERLDSSFCGPLRLEFAPDPDRHANCRSVYKVRSTTGVDKNTSSAINRAGSMMNLNITRKVQRMNPENAEKEHS